MISSGSGRSVDTSPGYGSQGIPRTLCSSLLSYRCSSGTCLTDCTTCVPVSSMTMRSVVCTRPPTNTPLVHLDSNFCRVRLRKSTHSPKLGISTLQGLPFKRMTVVRFTFVEERKKIGAMLHQPGQQRTSRFQSDSGLLFQEVLECPRKSMHRLDRTLDLSFAFALPLRRGFRHNFPVPTVLDGATKSNNAQLLIRLEDDTLVHHVIKIGHGYGCVTPFDGTGWLQIPLLFLRSCTTSTGSVSCALSSGCPKNPQSTEIVGTFSASFVFASTPQ